MKVGDKVQLETGESEVTRRVYDQLLKKTVFYAGEIRLTGISVGLRSWEAKYG